MRSRLLLALLVVLGVPTLARAQTHPCDGTPTINPQIAGPVKVGFCHDGKDQFGIPVTITGFTVLVDGTQRFNGPLIAQGAPNAAGLSYFETPAIVVALGSHTVSAIAASALGSSLPSTPFAFGTMAGLPSVPVKTRVGG